MFSNLLSSKEEQYCSLRQFLHPTVAYKLIVSQRGKNHDKNIDYLFESQLTKESVKAKMITLCQIMTHQFYNHTFFWTAFKM